jgi:two-component system, NarL family, sensor kinase
MEQPAWRVPLRYKVLALAILPLLLAMGIVAARVAYHSQELADEQSRLIEEQLLSAKRLELQSYVAIALSALTPLYADGSDEQTNQARAKAILASTRYGQDGYFFVYDQRGICLVHPTMPELVGRDLRQITDVRGRHVIPDLIETARNGGGFQRYAWPKPSMQGPVEKLAYVTLLSRWGWVVGTGVYMDDIARAQLGLRERASQSVVRTLRTLGLVASFAVALVFVTGMALNVRQSRLADAKLKAMAQRIVRLQEEERAQVSRNLHDGISQLLVAAKLQIESAERTLDAAPAGSPAELKTGLRQLSEAIVAVRDVSHEMRPLELDQLGLAGALQELSREFGQRTGLQVVFQASDEQLELSDEAAVALFRIAQQGLANVERHAQARSVRLEVSRRASDVSLLLQDDGRGFDVTRVAGSPDSGIGLRNMRERVEYLGGHLNVRSEAGRTELQVHLPITPRRAAI